MEILNTLPTFTQALVSAMYRLKAAPTHFWEKKGQLQNYLDYLLCSLDPTLSQKHMTAEVVGIRRETEETTTLILRPPARWQGFTAGQFMSIDVEIDGVRYRRNYSLSCSPEYYLVTGHLTLTIKTVGGGKVSRYLNKSVSIGDLVHISPAMGMFCLPDTIEGSPLTPVFIAGGSGITPVKAMIDALLEHSDSDKTVPNEILLIHHAKNALDMIFHAHFEQLAAQYEQFSYITHFSDQEGYISATQLLRDCPNIKETSVYLCGPEAFMASAKEIALSLCVSGSNIHTESFGGTTVAKINPSDAKSGTVNFVFANQKVVSDGNRSLLELAEQAGLAPKYGCRNGICHECKCPRPQGQLMNRLTGEMIEEDQSQIQSCISVPVGSVTVNNWEGK